MTKKIEKATQKAEARRTYYFTGEVTYIREHAGGVTELSVTYADRPLHKWYAVKLFGNARQLATGQRLVIADPFAQPDELAWTACPKVRKGDIVTIATNSAPKESTVTDAKGKIRTTPDGTKIVKTTLNLNSTNEIKIVKP